MHLSNVQEGIKWCILYMRIQTANEVSLNSTNVREGILSYVIYIFAKFNLNNSRMYIANYIYKICRTTYL